jgi:FkbM family methyltransferase
MDNALSKITSPKWLREAITARFREAVNSYGFKPKIIEREVNGERYNFYIGSVVGKTWYGNTVDLSEEMRFFRTHFVKQGDTVIECGAHHGAQTILLSRWVGDAGAVIVMEPLEENLRILRKNIEINELKNVVVVPKAAADRSGRIIMRPHSNGSVATSRDKAIEVESVSLDDLAKELNIRPTSLKIDVEGYEYQVLEGARSILANTPSVFVEVHTKSLPRYGRQFSDLWKLIDASRYEAFLQKEDHEVPVPWNRYEREPRDRIHLFLKPI